MTTKKEKKSVKKAKVLKSDKAVNKPAKRSVGGERGKIVSQTPTVSEIDKEKMAAFFSAGGLEPPAPKKVDSESVPAAGASEESPVVESKTESVATTAKAAEIKNVKTAVEAEIKEPAPEKQNLPEEKGELEMTTVAIVQTSAKDSNSDSFNTLPIFAVLIFMAAFWLYYISAAPSQKVAAVQVKQSQSSILTLEKKVQILQVEVAALQNKLAGLQNSVHKSPVKSQSVTVKKAVPAKPVKDSSFDKAPIPFWRNFKHPHTQSMNKSQAKKVAPSKAVPVAKIAPAAKVDSFSKAPVPFWRQADTGQSAAKAKEGSAHHDSSFDKAPIPFWRK